MDRGRMHAWIPLTARPQTAGRKLARMGAGYDHPPGMSGDAAARPHALRLSRSRRCITRACSHGRELSSDPAGCPVRPAAAGAGAGRRRPLQHHHRRCHSTAAAGCRQRPHEPIIGGTACSARSTLGEPACTSTTRSRSY
jgi:hypothetical protein